MTGFDGSAPEHPGRAGVNGRSQSGRGPLDGEGLSAARLDELLAGAAAVTDAERDLMRDLALLRAAQPTAPEELRERVMAAAARGGTGAGTAGRLRRPLWRRGQGWAIAGGVAAAVVASALVIPRGGDAPMPRTGAPSATATPSAGGAPDGALVAPTGSDRSAGGAPTAPAPGPESVMASPQAAGPAADAVSGAMRVVVAVGRNRDAGDAAGQLARVLTATHASGAAVTAAAGRVAVRGGVPTYTVTVAWPARNGAVTPTRVRQVAIAARGAGADAPRGGAEAFLARAVTEAAARPDDRRLSAAVRSARDALVRRDAPAATAAASGGPVQAVRLEFRLTG